MPKTDSIPSMVHDATSAAAEIGRTAWDAARDIAADAATVVGSTTSHAAHVAADAAVAGVDSVRRTAHQVVPRQSRRRGGNAGAKALWIGALVFAAIGVAAVMRRRRHRAAAADASVSGETPTWAEREERRLAAS